MKHLTHQLWKFVETTVFHTQQADKPLQASRDAFRLGYRVSYAPTMWSRWSDGNVPKKIAAIARVNELLEYYTYTKNQLTGALHGIRIGRYDWSEKAMMGLRNAYDDLLHIIAGFSTMAPDWIGYQVDIASLHLITATNSSVPFIESCYHLVMAMERLLQTYATILKVFVKQHPTQLASVLLCLTDVQNAILSAEHDMEDYAYVEELR